MVEQSAERGPGWPSHPINPIGRVILQFCPRFEREGHVNSPWAITKVTPKLDSWYERGGGVSHRADQESKGKMRASQHRGICCPPDTNDSSPLAIPNSLHTLPPCSRGTPNDPSRCLSEQTQQELRRISRSRSSIQTSTSPPKSPSRPQI